MERDGTNCALCDKPLDRHIKDPKNDWYITFDHIVPRSEGGANNLDNIQLAHRFCNEERGTDPIFPHLEQVEFFAT